MMQASTAAATGSGTISGIVQTGETREIIEGMEIILFNEDMEALTYDRSDDSGLFGFTSLDYGTYYVYPEMVGIETEGFMVILSEDAPSIELNIIVANGTASLSVDELNPVAFAGNLYPNPANGLFT